MISLDEARDYVDNVIRESQMDSQIELGLDFPHALLAILRQPAADRWAADTATSLQGRAFMIRAELQEPIGSENPMAYWFGARVGGS